MKHVLKSSFSLLNTDHVWLNSQWNYQNVISPYHRIYYIGDGEAELSGSNGVYPLIPGNLYMIPSFTLCNMRCGTQLEQYFVQFFELSPDGSSLFANNRQIMQVAAQENDLTHFKRLLEINPGRGLNRSDNPSFYEKQVFYKEYQGLNDYQSLAYFIETQGILLQLIARFLDSDMVKATPGAYIPDSIAASISYILLHLDQPLSVQLLAERAHYNPEYFARLFEKHTGALPIDFINEKRVERAQHLALSSQLSFAEIATRTGFGSQAYFSKVFKAVTGLTPGAFKKRGVQG
ncbi:transcriptional regulator, AraC family [Russula earlei]|uniref:Transcriptional regulator, AraC family n=1 Tax=Russula earlei TaxID=71964 RepID=A0ACC0TYL3_9AGAM|nr:transcriptional regulator, AraC family [Russula earlei]